MSLKDLPDGWARYACENCDSLSGVQREALALYYGLEGHEPMGAVKIARRQGVVPQTVYNRILGAFGEFRREVRNKYPRGYVIGYLCADDHRHWSLAQRLPHLRDNRWEECFVDPVRVALMPDTQRAKLMSSRPPMGGSVGPLAPMWKETLHQLLPTANKL